ncbi:MAG: hypothetical protein U9O98_09070, partial [Asgard group archaeon]|nr:hypothetical protein [Asgard group archaeon]
LDTRKDIVRLFPNLEQELTELRKIMAHQQVIFEKMSDQITTLEKESKKQSQTIADLKKETGKIDTSGAIEATLSTKSKKSISSLIKKRIEENIQPIQEEIVELKTALQKTTQDNIEKMEKRIDLLKDQVEDLSSKTELQMLEILESVNKKPAQLKAERGKNPKKSSASTKKKTSA